MTGGEALAPADVAFWQQRFPESAAHQPLRPDRDHGRLRGHLRSPRIATPLASIPIGRPI